MQITVNITPSIQAVGKAIGDAEIDKALHDFITEFALTTERYSKQVTPVDTGRLRASIGTGFLLSAGLSQGGTAVVAPHTNYAGWVHEGTRKMRARPFMQWGVEFAERRYNDKDLALRLDKKLRESLSRL